MAALILLAVFLLIPLLWLMGMYNGLVRLRQHVRESWSGIDTELKRRHNLIPNLVNTCKGYAAHEQAVLEAVTKARNAAAQASEAHAGVDTQSQRETDLTGQLGRLLAVAEAYPDLKASDHFLALQDELTNTEDRIQAARRFYNANVRDLNTRVESVPTNLVASSFGFTREPYFELSSPAERQNPDVSGF